MTVWFNAVASTAGGGKTYLNRLRQELRTRPGTFRIFGPDNLEPLAAKGLSGRLRWEQLALPRAARRAGVDALVCLGNICPLRSPVPRVLLSANALYFSDRHVEELRSRGERMRLLEHRLKKQFVIRSARAAEAVITPTQAMADLLGQKAIVSPFGAEASSRGSGGLVVVSHYNYFRNFETVLRALAQLRESDPDARLTLTTKLDRGLVVGGYDSTRAAELLDEFGIRDAVDMIGEIPQGELPPADLVICPGYVEAFSFTLAEAMAAGVPVIASDIPAHREVGGDAATYFSTFDPGDLARQCRQLLYDAARRSRLRAAGLERAKRFDWKAHFDTLFETIERVARNRHG